MAEFEIEGLDEVIAALEQLPLKMQAQVYKALNRRAVKTYVVDELRTALGGQYEKSVNVVMDRTNKTAVFGGIVRTRGVGMDPAQKIRWADKGTAARYTEKGAFRGQIIGRHELEPIIIDAVDKIVDFMNSEIGNEVAKILEKKIKSVERKITKLNL